MGETYWYISNSMVCAYLFKIGTIVHATEKEVCFKVYKHTNTQFRFLAAKVDLAAGGAKGVAGGKDFMAEVVQGSTLE